MEAPKSSHALRRDMLAFKTLSRSVFVADQNPFSAADDQLLEALLGTWQRESPERSNPGSSTQQQEARLAAWKARADTATQDQPDRQPSNDDVIVLD